MPRRVLLVEGMGRKGVSIVRSLGRDGFEVHVTGKTALTASRGAKSCARFFRHPDPSDEAAFWGFMKPLLEAGGYDVVIPQEADVLSIFSRHRAEIPAATRLPFASDALLEQVSDKHQVLERAEALGIPAPRSRLPKDAAELKAVAEAVGFPAIVKPRQGQGSHGVKRVDSQAELEAWYPRIVSRFGPALVQEYVPAGAGEYGASFLMDDHSQVLARFCHRRIRSFPVAGGPSTLRESLRCPEIEEAGEKLLQSFGWSGVAMVEFRRDPRTQAFRLLEVNHRFWGSLPLAVAAGVDFPAMLCRWTLGERVTPVLDYPSGVLGRWFFPGDVMHFLANPERFRLEPDFFQFRSPYLHYDIESLRDPLPMVWTVLSAVTDALRPGTLARYTRREGG